MFWLGSTVGLVAVTAFAIHRGSGELQLADAWLAAAVISVGIGYVEGGRIARDLGGTTVLCWAMIGLAPLAAVPLLVAVAGCDWDGVAWDAWLGFGYAGVVSMFLGSVLWYRGLAAGGIARIGQLNLVQPLLTLVWAAVLLHERLTWTVLTTAIVVVLSVAVCLRSRPPDSQQEWTTVHSCPARPSA